MSNHTPGPWTIGSRKGRIIVIDADCNEVCEAYAGAALIAAAPELLNALQRILPLAKIGAMTGIASESQMDHHLKEGLAVAAAAINKATA